MRKALLFWLSLLVCVANAAYWTIYPLIISERLGGEQYTGFYFAGIYALGLIASLTATYLFTRFSKLQLVGVSILGSAICLFLMSYADGLLALVLLDMVRSAFFQWYWIGIVLYVSELTDEDSHGGAQGIFFFFCNLGWLIGPLLSGYLADFWGLSSMLPFSSAIMLVSFVIFWIFRQRIDRHRQKRIQKLPPPEQVGIFANLAEFFRDRALRRTFFIAAGLHTWWAISYIYIPLETGRLGYGPEVVGWVVAGGILPLILLEPAAGRFADKYGLRRFIVAGFLILACSCLLFLPLYALPPLLLLMFALVNGGAALIEANKEALYFRNTVNEKRDRFYGVYNLAQPVTAIIVPLLSSGIFMLAGIFGVWVFTAAIMLLAACFALFVRK